MLTEVSATDDQRLRDPGGSVAQWPSGLPWESKKASVPLQRPQAQQMAEGYSSPWNVMEMRKGPCSSATVPMYRVNIQKTMENNHVS